MPNTDDFYNRLGDTNNRLAQLDSDLVEVKSSVDGIDADLKAGIAELNQSLSTGFERLIELGSYTNQALFHLSEQNDTIICILEHISKQTCALLNQAAEQTEQQKQIARDTSRLADLYAATHAEAALQRERELALKAEIEACCPPPKPQPPCSYEPCPTPDKLPQPPQVEPTPPK